MLTDDAGSLVRRLHAEVLAARDPAVVDAFFAPDFVSHTNPPGFPEGVEGVRRFFAMFRDAMPDIEVTIEELIVDGDRAAVATTIRGTHTGELLGLRAGSRRLRVSVPAAELLAGSLPGRALRLVREWLDEHRTELEANPVAPLR